MYDYYDLEELCIPNVNERTMLQRFPPRALQGFMRPNPSVLRWDGTLCIDVEWNVDAGLKEERCDVTGAVDSTFVGSGSGSSSSSGCGGGLDRKT